VNKADRIRALEMQVKFLSHQMLKAADHLDQMLAENDELRRRGDKLASAFEANDGTVGRAMVMSQAVAAWREFQEEE